jgi:hypothetical protein
LRDLLRYVDAIRKQVCPNCSEDENGRCAFRERFDCAVDNFLYLVVDVIEDVKRRERFHRSFLEGTLAV